MIEEGVSSFEKLLRGFQKMFNDMGKIMKDFFPMIFPIIIVIDKQVF